MRQGSSRRFRRVIPAARALPLTGSANICGQAMINSLAETVACGQKVAKTVAIRIIRAGSHPISCRLRPARTGLNDSGKCQPINALRLFAAYPATDQVAKNQRLRLHIKN